MAEICSRVVFEETELRLGLSTIKASTNSNGKRGYESEDDVDLKLNLCNSKQITANKNSNADGQLINDKKETKEKLFIPSEYHDLAKPPTKAQVVGWPPVPSFRKNILAVQKSSMEESEKMDGGNGAAFVKVSVDGAPYLRKVDLKMYKSYQHLSNALANMFSSFTIGTCGSQLGMKDFMNESKVMDDVLISGSEYVSTYQDKDGDWMLAGDVPWEMFVHSCKRLSIMKGKEAIGLAPRAMEKCNKTAN